MKNSNKDKKSMAKRIVALCERYERCYEQSGGMGSSATFYISRPNSRELRVSGHTKPDSSGFNYNTDDWADIILAVADGEELKPCDKNYLKKMRG
jgi:hypothetical protein